MKAVALLFMVLLIMASSCLGAPRRAMLGGIYGQEQRHRHGESMKNAMEKSNAKYTGSRMDNHQINNHHSIPRQYYNDPSGSSQGDGDGGTG